MTSPVIRFALEPFAAARPLWLSAISDATVDETTRAGRTVAARHGSRVSLARL